MENKESKQLGTLLAVYVLTSEDDLAKSFRAEYCRLTCGDKPESVLPPKNNYVALWRYIQSQAQRGVDWRLRANGNRSEMARQLTYRVACSLLEVRQAILRCSLATHPVLRHQRSPDECAESLLRQRGQTQISPPDWLQLPYLWLADPPILATGGRPLDNRRLF